MASQYSLIDFSPLAFLSEKAFATFVLVQKKKTEYQMCVRVLRALFKANKTERVYEAKHKTRCARLAIKLKLPRTNVNERRVGKKKS